MAVTPGSPDNPYYREYGESLLYPAKRLFSITPHDKEGLERTIKCLRVFNPFVDAAVVSLRTLQGDIVQVPVPPGLTMETVQITHVYETGTTRGLYLHGYSDGGIGKKEIIDDGRPVNFDFTRSENSGWIGNVI